MDPTTPSDASAASLLDQEASIWKQPHGPQHVPALSIAGPKRTLDALARRFGGTTDRIATDLWRWTIAGEPLTRMLTQLRPLLTRTAELADLALDPDSTPEAMRRATNRILEPDPPAPNWTARAVAAGWAAPQTSLFEQEGSASFCGPWPRSGTTRNGATYPRPPWAPPTTATDGSSSPTRQDGRPHPSPAT
ncbi:hypothetical protein [Euzebya pacifica]|uniref:hypothetical protein n=1 Tax=Euzebya pacifica TaxID=1608957 RepID=UPI0013DEF58A|nr:hypothetical protein [Euzebya pacifica]